MHPRVADKLGLMCLACMQVVLLQLPLIKDEAQVKTLVKKLGPPLVTLLSEEAEIQYVALRNINLIVQKHPEVLSYEIKVRSIKDELPVCIPQIRQAQLAVCLMVKHGASQLKTDRYPPAVRSAWLTACHRTSLHASYRHAVSSAGIYRRGISCAAGVLLQVQ